MMFREVPDRRDSSLWERARVAGHRVICTYIPLSTLHDSILVHPDFILVFQH